MPIKVAVVEDHEIFREGIIAILKELDVELVGWGECGADAYNLAQTTDVLFLDLVMPEELTAKDILFDHGRFLEHAQINHPKLKTIIISSQMDNDLLERTLPLVSGYLFKQDGTKREIERALSTNITPHGLPYFSETIRDAIQNPKSTQPHKFDPLFDKHDRAILLAIFQNPNASYKEVGQTLGFAEVTIKKRVAAINTNLEEPTLRGTLLALLKSKWIEIDDL